VASLQHAKNLRQSRGMIAEVALMRDVGECRSYAAAKGIPQLPALDKGRKLAVPIGDGKLELVLAKAPDIITYVEHGVCDMGIVGKDTIMEGARSLYEVMDLGLGRCRMVLAAARNKDFYSGFRAKSVATKYPVITRAFFEGKAMDVNIIKIEGSVELAPLLGLADGIVDLVETGETLRANGLTVVEDVAAISARVIVNIEAMKTRKAEINAFLQSIAGDTGI
jgi:ATP phosphoribosyltransferase